MYLRAPVHLGVALLILSVGSAAAQYFEGSKRVAYLSTLPEREAAERIGAIGKRIEARWPLASSTPRVVIEYRTFRYELPATTKVLADEPDDVFKRRNEEIAQRNDVAIREMLEWKPEVIFAPGALPAKAAAEKTGSIPVVFGCKCNPLADGWGLVKDPSRPERNLTGFTRYHIGMVGEGAAHRLNLHRKRIELLQKASAKPVRRVGAIYGQEYDERKWAYEMAARELGVEWVKLRLTEDSIAMLPALLKEKQVDVGLVLADTFLDKFSSRLVKAAMASPIPIMFPWDEADAGAWMHYGTVVDVPDKAAEYIVNILRGRKVADYPVEFPKQMELAVNFTTAKRHNWEFPRGFLLLIDRIVE